MAITHADSRYRPRHRSTPLFILVVAVFSGCATQTTTVPNPIEIDSSEYTRIFNAAIQVLRDRGFRIDHQSHRLGTIATHYQPAPTLFEPWLRQTAETEQALTNSFNEQQRMIVIQLEPLKLNRSDLPHSATKPSAGYQLRVQVMVERQQFPDRFLTGSTSGHSVFGSLSSTPTELQERGIKGTYWQPIGRDTHLEQILIGEIVRQSLDMQNPDASAITSNSS